MKRANRPWWFPFPFAVGWTGLGVVAALKVPLYSNSLGGHPTLVAENGIGVLYPFAVIAALSTVAWAAASEWRKTRGSGPRILAWSCVILLGLLTVLGLLTFVVAIVAGPAAGLCAIGINRGSAGPRPPGPITYPSGDRGWPPTY